MAEGTFWSALTVAVTLVLVDVREEIGEAHVALSYLLIVLGASARGGRRLGMVLAFVCFLAFNFFFLPPYHTFTVHRSVDWLVLLAFLVASAVATQLLHRAHAEAEEAKRRAREIDRLAALGAETLNVARAEDAVTAIAQVIQSELGVDRCEIYLSDPSKVGVELIASAAATPDGVAQDTRSEWLDLAAGGTAVAETPGGSARIIEAVDEAARMAALLGTPAQALLIPLSVRDRAVGVLRLGSVTGIRLDARQQRFAQALAYYGALALERVLLVSVAEHAEALREADELKDALLASVSHDFRTPLTSIKALAHDMAADGDERAIVVEEEADRLNHFVSDLLDFSTAGRECGRKPEHQGITGHRRTAADRPSERRLPPHRIEDSTRPRRAAPPLGARARRNPGRSAPSVARAPARSSTVSHGRAWVDVVH